MAGYEIEWNIAYEGIQQHGVDTLEDAVAWLEANESRYERTLYNVTMRGPTGELDVYELMRRAKAGEPLTAAGFLETEAEVVEILSDVRGGRVGQATLDRVERLRSLLVELLADVAPTPPGRSGP